jgi:ClpP class serine protease
MPLSRRLIAQQLLNRPVAWLPSEARVLISAFLDDDASPSVSEQDAYPAGYDVIAGIGVISIEGTLLQKTGMLRPFWGFTGYDGIRANFVDALSNPAVKAIVLEVNSGGGEVSGCFDLADTIYNARGVKPIFAICADQAYSAAYALASAADYITVPRTGGVGSVGIISMITDFSKAIADSGLKIFFVHFGADKAAETRAVYEGVEPELLARIQTDVDMMGQLFAETVARNRGIPQTAVLATQADYYLGDKGVKVGFADAVMSPEDAFAAVLGSIS